MASSWRSAPQTSPLWVLAMILARGVCGSGEALANEETVVEDGPCDSDSCPELMAPADPAYDNLVAWLEKGGVQFTGVSGRSSSAGGGRGLFATRDLQEGELLFGIPRNFWLSEASVAAGSAVSAIMASDDVVAKHCRPGNAWALILALDFERHNKWSPWRPYIDGLPDPTSPVWWSRAALDALQSPILATEITNLKDYIRSKYDALFPYLSERYPKMFPKQLHTLESFTWSALSVWGRAFDLGAWNSTKTVWGMMPFADYANHVPYTSNDYSMDAFYYDFASPEPRNEGDEIFISYGDGKTTYHFLAFYGFIPEGFEAGDYITLDISSDTASFYGLGSMRANLHGFVGSDGRIHEEWLSAIADAIYGDKDATDLVLAVAEAGVQAVNSGFATTLNADEEMLKAGLPTYDEHVTVATRVRFKRVLAALEKNIAFRRASGRWPGSQAEKSLVYRFTDNLVGMSPTEAAKEALFRVELDFPNSRN